MHYKSPKTSFSCILDSKNEFYALDLPIDHILSIWSLAKIGQEEASNAMDDVVEKIGAFLTTPPVLRSYRLPCSSVGGK